MKLKWWLIGAFALVAAGCKPALKTPSDKDVKQEGCGPAIASAPADFNRVAQTVSGAVTMKSCALLAVGVTATGEPVIAKYLPDGNPDTSFAQNGVYRPFVGLLRGFNVNVQRLAVLPDGYLALGWYARADGASEFLAFKIAETGYLNYDFGPKRDGLIRADILPFQSVRNVDAPTVQANAISVAVTYYLNASGTQFTKILSMAMNGRQDMPALSFPIPRACDVINHTAFTGDVTYEIHQSTCDSLTWIAQGPGVRDNLQVIPGGQIYTSGALGEFSMHYDGTRPVLMSRDSLGNVKSEFMVFVQGRTFICGTQVRPEQRYLVFSRKAPQDPDWLTNCWFL